MPIPAVFDSIGEAHSGLLCCLVSALISKTFMLTDLLKQVQPIDYLLHLHVCRTVLNTPYPHRGRFFQLLFSHQIHNTKNLLKDFSYNTIAGECGQMKQMAS